MNTPAESCLASQSNAPISRLVRLTAKERKQSALWIRGWRSMARVKPNFGPVTLSAVRRMIYTRFA